MMKFRDTFNRVVIVIACLVLIAAVVALVIFPATIFTTVGEWILGWGQVFQNGDMPEAAIGAVIALVVVLLLALVIIWQVRSRRGEYVRVQRVTGGMAEVRTDSAKEMLEHQLRTIPGVVNIDSQVRARGNRVGVQVAADIVRGSNVPETANQMIKETQRVFTDELGLQVDGAPEVSVTVVREEVAAEQRAAESPQPASYAEVPPADESDSREPRRQRKRQRDREQQRERERQPEREPVMLEEERTPVVPESYDPEVQQRDEPAAEEAWLHETEEREPQRYNEERGPFEMEPDYEEPVTYETDDIELEDDEEYRLEGHEPADPYDEGKEIRTH
jgi:hypothetical protein